MAGSIQSITDNGTYGTLIDIECHVSKGLPNIMIIGFANKAVDEAKERVRSAFASSNLALPRKRITINLAPADVRKDDTSFDLAIATAILQASGQVAPQPKKQVIIGELGLDGNVRPVRGVIGKLLAGRKLGIKSFVIPLDNLVQAQLVPGLEIVPVSNLNDLYLHLSGAQPLEAIDTDKNIVTKIPPKDDADYNMSEIIGQEQAKRALEIAAAGGHNVLLNGPPGAGKSMLARALASILPTLSQEEMLEVTQLHSLANKNYDAIVNERPFRSPHHSASDIAIIGGGQNPHPGEISLSHHGVLFMDEFPEFKRSTIEALRQPLEERVITVARAKDTFTYPADFILVATSNPCPCGFYGSSRPCICLPQHINNYERKLSGPILDRIDLYVVVEEVVHDKLLKPSPNTKRSQEIRESVNAARARQTARFGSPGRTNNSMSNKDIRSLAKLTSSAEQLLNQAAAKLQLSARSYLRAVKVARTIADLEASDEILVPHISEALQYRRQVTP